MQLKFLGGFDKTTQTSIFTKILPVEAEMFYADRWTDMTKLIVAFRNISNAPGKGKKRNDFRSIDFGPGLCWKYPEREAGLAHSSLLSFLSK
jgi:hypothetical protein